jgi:hypothetical protein
VHVINRPVLLAECSVAMYVSILYRKLKVRFLLTMAIKVNSYNDQHGQRGNEQGTRSFKQNIIISFANSLSTADTALGGFIFLKKILPCPHELVTGIFYDRADDTMILLYNPLL